MTILELAKQLEDQINGRVRVFVEKYDKAQAIVAELNTLESDLMKIMAELEPVEAYVMHFNPKFQPIFESLRGIPAKAELEINQLHSAFKAAQAKSKLKR